MEIKDDEKSNIKTSLIGKTKIPAVLILEGNRTYGRDKKSGKLLYKCRPDDGLLPIFLVPYEIKRIGFNKSLVNLYVTIQLTHWENKHPQGQLTLTIGPVNVNENFYDYQIYCKGLHLPIHSLTKHAHIYTKHILEEEGTESNLENNLETRYEYNVFSIDPEACSDFDDAFSIKTLDNDRILLSIYISNVPAVLEEGGLWQHFADRIATIYLPNKKIPMLPHCLSDGICSLKSGTKRQAFTLDLIIHKDTGDVISCTYLNTIICISRNYIYNEHDLLVNSDYMLLLDTSRKMCTNILLGFKEGIKDSHDVVAYLMIFMNHRCAQDLEQGIFRQVTNNDSISNNPLHFYNGSYTLNKHAAHKALNLETYTQITSPIRRLVDLLNLLQIQKQYGLATFSEHATWFYNRMTSHTNIERINEVSKKIKRVQNECALLQMCSESTFSMDTIYDGLFIDVEKSYKDKIGTIYLVYLPELKLYTTCILHDVTIVMETPGQFKLFLFHNETKMKRKIRALYIE